MNKQINLNVDIKNGSPDRFGYEWHRYNKINPYHKIQFFKWLPFFESDDWKNKIFLDAGCGMGRNSFWPLSFGAKKGYSIDVSQKSLDSAKELLKKFRSSEVLYCSIYDIPYRKKFDISFSIGVIHHLEFPLLGLKSLVSATKSGGLVSIWVYGKENNEWIIKYFNPLRNSVFSKLPISLLHHISLYPSLALYLWLKMYPQEIEYYRMIRSFSFNHLRSIVFDQMLPVIANYWTKNEVIDLMKKAKLKNIKIQQVNSISWAAIGTV